MSKYIVLWRVWVLQQTTLIMINWLYLFFVILDLGLKLEIRVEKMYELMIFVHIKRNDSRN